MDDVCLCDRCCGGTFVGFFLGTMDLRKLHVRQVPVSMSLLVASVR